MKKKIINGILLVAMLFATTSAFVSCKDTDSDYKATTDAQIANLKKELADLQNIVNGIKSCNCDMTSINNKIAALEAAIAAIQIPSLDGYLKTADLDAKVQALLADYYTKAQVDAAIAKALEGYAKTSDIPDIPDPGLTQDEVNALIIAALADYAKLTDLPDAGLTQAEIQKLIDDAIAKININPGGLTQDEVQKLIDDAIAKITPPEGLSKDEIQKMIDDALAKFKEENPIPEQITKEQIIEIIKETIDTTEVDLTVIYLTEVTSLNVDKVVNPLFELSTPFGVNSNVLISFFGEKAKRDIYFPKGAEEPIIYKGEYFTEGIGNAGKLYVTVNPSSVDFSGKTLKLVSTTGNEAPVELTPLVESNEELGYFSSRGDNAFYEAYATISEKNISKAYFSWEPADKQEFKDQIVNLFKSHGKEDVANMLQAITNLVAGNEVPAYRLQASWGDGYYTYSPANIAAVAIKPLTYAFDLADEAEISDTPISELERLETDIVNWSTSREGTRTRAWNWLRKFNRMTNIWLNNINWALQPTMFIDVNGEISRPGIMNNYKEYEAGEIKLIPSSWSVELLAPAFKKYVVVTSVDGVDVKADDPVNAGLLGKVIAGSVNEIPFTLEPGKTYAIQYSALDYEGNIRTLNYFIKGKKK